MTQERKLGCRGFVRRLHGCISSAGGIGGSIDGPGFDRDAGGADVPQGGADGRTPDGGLDTGRDGGPDTREVGPSTPEIGPDTSDVGRDLGPDTPQDAPVDAVALPAGLVVYYPCESASGTTLPDQSGNGHNGTLSAGSPDGGAAPSGAGFAISSGGKIGNALTLAKAGYGYVSVPPVVFNGATAITIATWIKVTTAQNWARVFDIGVNAHINVNTRTGTKYFNLVPQNGSNPSQLEFAISINGFDPANQQVLHGTAIAPSNGWKHVAVTLDGSQGSLYVDGQLTVTDASVKLRPSDLGAIDYAYIGRSQFIADPYFDGQIDEFRVYNRALSATEIQTLAQFTGH